MSQNNEFEFPEYSDKPSNKGGAFPQLAPGKVFRVRIVGTEARKGNKVGTKYDGQWQRSFTVRPVGMDGNVTGPRAFVNVDLPLLRKFKDDDGKVVIDDPSEDIWDKFKRAVRCLFNETIPVYPPQKNPDGQYQQKAMSGEFYGPVYTKEQVYSKSDDCISKRLDLTLKQIAQRMALDKPYTNPATGETVNPFDFTKEPVDFLIETSEVQENGKIYVNIAGPVTNPKGLAVEFENFERKQETDSDITF